MFSFVSPAILHARPSRRAGGARDREARVCAAQFYALDFVMDPFDASLVVVRGSILCPCHVPTRVVIGCANAEK